MKKILATIAFCWITSFCHASQKDTYNVDSSGCVSTGANFNEMGTPSKFKSLDYGTPKIRPSFKNMKPTKDEIGLDDGPGSR